MNKFARFVIPAAAMLGTLAARAQGTAPDTSSITTAATNVGIVGTAVFAVYVGVKTFKWIRAAL
jgi:Inovirus Coat protein B